MRRLAPASKCTKLRISAILFISLGVWLLWWCEPPSRAGMLGTLIAVAGISMWNRSDAARDLERQRRRDIAVADAVRYGAAHGEDEA